MDQKIVKAFVGDSNAIIANFPEVIPDFPEVIQAFSSYYVEGVPGLPVWDTKLNQILEVSCNRFNIVFWSCVTELHGIRRYLEVEKINSLPQSERFINFQGLDRCCYKQKYYTSITKEQRLFLLKCYLEQIEFFLEKYPNIVLVPLSAKFMLPSLPEYLRTPPTYQSLLNHYKHRCVDLSLIERTDLANFRDDDYHLSVKGFLLLKNILDYWVF